MSEKTRPLEVRLTEYGEALRLTVDGIIEAANVVDEVHPTKDTGALRETACLLAHVADDIARLVDGEELRHWRIEGELG